MRRTAYPISFIRRTDLGGRQGYTLVELMIAAVLSGFILAGVLSATLLIGRSSANAANYSELESEARRALEMFGREARMASSINTTLSATSVTLGIPSTPTQAAYTVTYAFDTNRNFVRTDSITGTPAILIRGVQAFPNANPFNYYRLVNQNYSNGYLYNTTNNAVEVKQIEINFIAKRTTTTVATATNKVISARFILRNH